jgi:hypothetical protein
VTLVSGVWRSARLWAVASNERAVANARAAATECSRARVERAEVEQYLAGMVESASVDTGRAAAGAR